MRVKRAGRWLTWTWDDYWRDVQRFAGALARLHVEPFETVGVMGFNAPGV
jgi:long-subunit acyl-CoA synthetase (AMP-forming)